MVARRSPSCPTLDCEHGRPSRVTPRCGGFQLLPPAGAVGPDAHARSDPTGGRDRGSTPTGGRSQGCNSVVVCERAKSAHGWVAPIRVVDARRRRPIATGPGPARAVHRPSPDRPLHSRRRSPGRTARAAAAGWSHDAPSPACSPPWPSSCVALTRRPAAAGAATDPVGQWPLQPGAGGGRAASTRPSRPWGPGHRGVDLRRHARAAGPRGAAGHGRLRRHHRRPRRGRRRPRRHPHHLRAGRDHAAPWHAGRRRRRASARSALPGSHCFPRACLHWGWIRGETYLDPLRLVGGGPVRLLPLAGLPSTGRAVAAPRRDLAVRRLAPLVGMRRLLAVAWWCSGARVGLLVGLAEPVGGDVGVELRRRERGVARAAPGPSAGRRHPRAGGWPRCGAARGDRGRARPGRRRSGGGRGSGPPAGRSAGPARRGTVRRPAPSTAQRGPARGEPAVDAPARPGGRRAPSAPCGPCRGPARTWRSPSRSSTSRPTSSPTRIPVA